MILVDLSFLEISDLNIMTMQVAYGNDSITNYNARYVLLDVLA